jgi:hypothetical protein
MAVDGVIALNPIQVLQYVASGALGQSPSRAASLLLPWARQFISVSRGCPRQCSSWQAGG